MLSNRPKIYKPNQAHLVNLYNLHHDLDFDATLETEVDRDDHEYGSVSKMLITGQRFTRVDGKKINYFQTIQDATNNREPYPTLDEWLIGYKKLIASGQLSPSDISIVTLVQVQNGRRHFNTLLVHADNKGVFHTYIIEPRSSNLTRSLKYYPVAELGQKIKSNLADVQGVKKVKFSNPKMGHQPFLDDVTCGAHHINYTELIAQLSDADLENGDALKSVLGAARLDRRDHDNAKIDVVIGSMHEEAEKMHEGESKEIKDDVIIEEDLDGFEEDVKKKPSDYKADASLTSREVQRNLHHTLTIRRSDAFENAIEEIGKYGLHNKLSFSLFGGHTRQKTAQFMGDVLRMIKDANIPNQGNAGNTVRIHQAGLLIFSCYLAINGSSNLRDHLGRALAILLNCESEYNHVLSKTFNKRDKAMELFRDRLDLLGFSHASGFEGHMKLFHDMKKINELDTSFFNKISDKRRGEVEKTRESIFDEIKKNMHLDKGNQVSLLKL